MSEVAIGTPGALRLALSTLAAGLYPPAPMSFPEWIESNIVLIDGPFAGQLYSFHNAPPLRGIAECLGDDHPCNLVTVRKSQQTGASILALAWLLFIADREPANTLYGCPGIDFLRDLNGQKLQPLIDAWQKHIKRTVIIPQTSRSGAGSTTYEKRFPGGYAALGNANAVMDFTGKTCKKGVKDEFSKWQHIPGFGDPNDLFRGRFTAFRRTKDWKHLEISTPEVDTGDETGEHSAHCRIDRSFKRSDQRFFNVLCPECGKPFVYAPSGLVLVREQPHKSRFACNKPACGHHLSEAERVASIRGAEPAGYGWIPSIEGSDRHPGFHYDAFLSLMMSLEAIAEETLEAERKGTEQARKGLSTLIHGLPYRYRGDAPDHTRLLERREEDHKRRRVPAGGLLLTAAADVQGRGIWFEVVAHGADGQTWLVDYGYLPGDTSYVSSKVYRDLLDATVDATFPDAFGTMRRVDALGVDTGWESHTVYAFVRAAQRANPDTGRDLILALDGREGWSTPAIGTPSLKDIDLDGRRIKQGVQLWPVGTWPLKSNLYANLHKAGIRSGELQDPPGYCHFGMWVDEGYFKQITSERLEDIVVRGQVTGRRWAKSTDNHLLDCRVYNLALAEYLGVSSMTPDEWAALARARGLPDALTAVDLFTPKHRLATPPVEPSGTPDPAPQLPADPTPEPVPAPAGDWFGRHTTDWF